MALPEKSSDQGALLFLKTANFVGHSSFAQSFRSHNPNRTIVQRFTIEKNDLVVNRIGVDDGDSYPPVTSRMSNQSIVNLTSQHKKNLQGRECV